MSQRHRPGHRQWGGRHQGGSPPCRHMHSKAGPTILSCPLVPPSTRALYVQRLRTEIMRGKILFFLSCRNTHYLANFIKINVYKPTKILWNE